jgi:hypothetical protein
MARIRSIKPEYWTDEKAVEMSPLARLLFIGLWNFADDEGRMVYSPKRIKMQILPAESSDISELLGEIRGKSLVEVYEVDGIEYLQITNFKKHQKIDKRTASKLPSPPNPSESPRIPPTDQGREWIKEGKGKDTPPPSAAFVRFWDSYPRKKSKGHAERAWLKIKPDEQLAASIIAGVERAKTSADWLRDDGQFIPHPATWLNARGWEDELGGQNTTGEVI